MFTKLGRLSILAVILSVSACAVMQPKTDEERVFELAEKRQAALLTHDFKKAYAFMSPGYRELNTVEKFMSDYAGVYSWQSSSVLSSSCDDDICKVNVEVLVDIGLMQSGRRTEKNKVLIPRVNQETWLEIDNKWWFSNSK